MKFKELHVGQEFDFVSPIMMYNSYYNRVRKISALRYCEVDSPKNIMVVGSVSAEVYHVSTPTNH